VAPSGWSALDLIATQNPATTPARIKPKGIALVILFGLHVSQSPRSDQMSAHRFKSKIDVGRKLLFFQCYPSFQRFDCKVFLTDARRYFSGAPVRVMIDNTHVVVQVIH
jgi:hypothetical protein